MVPLAVEDDQPQQVVKLKINYIYYTFLLNGAMVCYL